MKILYFASLREAVGRAEEDVDPPAAAATVGQLMDWLTTLSPGHAQALGRPLVRAAVNQDHVGFDHPVAKDDEVAFFPPVTGG